VNGAHALSGAKSHYALGHNSRVIKIKETNVRDEFIIRQGRMKHNLINFFSRTQRRLPSLCLSH
jgi:hypothetical protein